MNRRAVLRGLVAAGGTSALAACLNVESGDTNAEIPTGDPQNRPARQHAWNESLRTDDNGNTLLPHHHVYLALSYEGSDRETDRSVVETALTDLERAYAASNDGLLCTLGYSPAYFERFGEPLTDVDLPPAGNLVPGENVDVVDNDAFLHLASDHASAVLGAETALFGDAVADDGPTGYAAETGTRTANGVEVTGLDGVFEVVDRRTGFFGPGLPKKNQDEKFLQGVPDGAVDGDAPSFMGFWSRFQGSQATEDRVTIQDGRFAGGTTQHVSALALVLTNWVDHSTEEKIARLFAPDIDPETVGEHGEKLTTDNPVEALDMASLMEAANDKGVVGHAQKLSRYRENGRPPILRRDVSSADNKQGWVFFVTLQRAFEDFRRLRLAMEGIDIAAETPVGERQDNGILQYFRTRRRGNYLIPPRELRALP
jgi:hypothetical protein